MSKAYGTCTCPCHRNVGIMHSRPCCSPKDDDFDPINDERLDAWADKENNDLFDYDQIPDRMIWETVSMALELKRLRNER